MTEDVKTQNNGVTWQGRVSYGAQERLEKMAAELDEMSADLGLVGAAESAIRFLAALVLKAHQRIAELEYEMEGKS